MTATQHPTLDNHWIVIETQTVDQTVTDADGNETTEQVEVAVGQPRLVACAASDSSAERAIEIITAEPAAE
tara:strand:- start:196 stop:408 length:213 start_codon:yes stop_codon:yes gene_type:complete